MNVLYKDLRTNIPLPLMQLEGLHFSEQPETGSYASARQVSDYLLAYAAKFDLAKLVRFRHEVTAISPRSPDDRLTGWTIGGNCNDSSGQSEPFKAGNDHRYLCNSYLYFLTFYFYFC